MRPFGHALLGALVGLVTCGAQERAASADPPNYLAGVGVVTYGILAGGTFAFADIAYGIEGEHLPPGWAWSQLVLAGVPWTIFGVLLTEDSLSGSQNHQPLVLGLGVTAVGTWFIGDAIYSLVAPASKPRTPGSRYRPPIALGFVRNHELTFTTVGVSF